MYTPEQWSEIFGITIHDPDGWRLNNSPRWETPIDRDEFTWRMSLSTIQVNDRDKWMNNYRNRYAH